MRALSLFAGLSLAVAAAGAAGGFEVLDSEVAAPDSTLAVGQVDLNGAKAIEWEDLSPPLSAAAEAAIVELNARIDMMSEEEITKAIALIEENGDKLIQELDGERISIAGFVAPLDFEATSIKAFVLVPYFGACIHVPPPPPNQIIFVQYEDGLPMETLDANYYRQFRVTGALRALPASTELAEVGYQLSAESVGVVTGL